MALQSHAIDREVKHGHFFIQTLYSCYVLLLYAQKHAVNVCDRLTPRVKFPQQRLQS